MANLKDWVEETADGQDIIGCVIGEMGWGGYKSDVVPSYVDHVRGKVLTWEEAIPWLSYKFDMGYGTPGCEAIYVDIMPDMPGG